MSVASRTIISHLTRTADAINFAMKTSGQSPLVVVPKLETFEDFESFSHELSNAIKFPHLRYLQNNLHLDLPILRLHRTRPRLRW